MSLHFKELNIPAIEVFITKLKRRQIHTSQKQLALETIQLLRHFIHQYKGANITSLISCVKEVGKKLMKVQPYELAIGNIIRRVLRIIRDEAHDYMQNEDCDLRCPSPVSDSFKGTNARPSPYLDSFMYNLIALDKDKRADSFEQAEESEPIFFNCKTQIIQAINEFIDELETMDASIANHSSEHIHSNEIIMTFGRSKSVEEFLLSAARKRQFQVIVAESAPNYEGQNLAVSLASAGIETTLIPDSAIYAMLSRVNKVILGCHGVLANGGIIGSSGTLLIALAAKQHSTPIVVLAGLYKLSPVYPYDLNRLNVQMNPQRVISNLERNDDNFDVETPAFDYVPPSLVSIFVTNVGSNSPSYIYRLLGECYSEEDFAL